METWLRGCNWDEKRVRSLSAALSRVPDPRDARGRRHQIGPILTQGVCAMLCGARSLYAIAQWGRDHGPRMSWTLGYGCPKTPAVSTLHLVYTHLDVAALEAALSQWFTEQGLPEGEVLTIDGKSLRGIHGDEVPGVHLVALYAQGAGCVLAQKGGQGQGR